MNKRNVFEKKAYLIFSELFSLNVNFAFLELVYSQNYFNLSKRIYFEAIQNGEYLAKKKFRGQ